MNNKNNNSNNNKRENNNRVVTEEVLLETPHIRTDASLIRKSLNGNGISGAQILQCGDLVDCLPLR